MNFSYKAILFDWAYTLVDLIDEDDHAAFVRLTDFLRERGVELPDFDRLFTAYQDMFYGLIAESRQTHREACFETVLRYLFFRFGIELQDRATWTEILTVYYDVIHGVRILYPDVVGTLEAMQKAGVRMGVVSNTTNPKFIKEEEMHRTRLDRFFEFALYSSVMPYRKPHPSIFRAAVERFGLEAREILFVGDDLRMDVAGPQAVGLSTAWLNRKGASPIDGIVPDYQLTRLDDLLRIEPLKV
ncbi:hypothetical protein UR09_00790 [Candidatus Nitromaritima sp. SCGC AAA799-A02]|nr:hypothetical protein UR09_00790 [Candidatus Nitromaritima sp. SCGC AAA799-A02]